MRVYVEEGLGRVRTAAYLYVITRAELCYTATYRTSTAEVISHPKKRAAYDDVVTRFGAGGQ